MSWINDSWITEDSSGSGSGSSEVTKQEFDKVKKQVTQQEQKIQLTAISETIITDVLTNDNLLYNSTGIVNLTGWFSTDKVSIFRDDYVLDDNCYFIITGNNAPDGFISMSIEVTPGETYTFSGSLIAQQAPLTVIFGYQDKNNLNSTESTLNDTILTDTYQDWTQVSFSSVAPDNAQSAYVCFIFEATDENMQAGLKRLKVEKGNVATKWVPSLTDPYQANVVFTGYDAAALLKEQQ
jgi:hypothetical protein